MFASGSGLQHRVMVVQDLSLGVALIPWLWWTVPGPGVLAGHPIRPHTASCGFVLPRGLGVVGQRCGGHSVIGSKILDAPAEALPANALFLFFWFRPWQAGKGLLRDGTQKSSRNQESEQSSALPVQLSLHKTPKAVLKYSRDPQTENDTCRCCHDLPRSVEPDACAYLPFKRGKNGTGPEVSALSSNRACHPGLHCPQFNSVHPVPWPHAAGPSCKHISGLARVRSVPGQVSRAEPVGLQTLGWAQALEALWIGFAGRVWGGGGGGCQWRRARTAVEPRPASLLLME